MIALARGCALPYWAVLAASAGGRVYKMRGDRTESLYGTVGPTHELLGHTAEKRIGGDALVIQKFWWRTSFAGENEKLRVHRVRGWKTRAICALRCGTRIHSDRSHGRPTGRRSICSRANTRKSERGRGGGSDGLSVCVGATVGHRHRPTADDRSTQCALLSHRSRKAHCGLHAPHVPCMLEDVTLVLHAAQ